MKDEDVFGTVSVAVLLILTAWGNAWALFVVSALGLVAGLLMFRRNSLRGAVLAATVACVLAAAMAAVMLLWRGR